MDTQTKQTVHSGKDVEIAQHFGVDPKVGLSESEIAARRQKYGVNSLRRHATQSPLSILLHQFKGVIVWLLGAAAGLSLYLGDLVEAAAIGVVLLINGAIGFITELRAARSMEALHKIAQVKTRVRRDGQDRMVDAQDLVPGDIVLLEAGDIVTADMRLLTASGLHVDESVLTGESMPVAKQTEELPEDTVIAERANMAFKGSSVSQGSAEAVVTGTGMATELGRISDLTRTAEAESSPLERRLDRLGHKLVWLTLGLTLFIIALGVWRGYPIAQMVETGVALAVAAVPEGLPVVATLCLARGMWRMAQRNALVARLSAVETLGATTIILTDKTGTLTENRMTAVGMLLSSGDVEIDTQDHRFVMDGAAIALSDQPGLAEAVKAGAMCNTASLGNGDQRAGDPMELALLDLAQAAGHPREEILQDKPICAQHAFDPDAKMMATVHDGPDGIVFAVKGAPEEVLASCDRVLTEGGVVSLDASMREDWSERARAAAGRGLRLLGVASKTTDDPAAEPYEGLILLGMVCLSDPIRADVPEAIAASRRAGVRVVMMTGDHAQTAAEIARQAGLAGETMNVLTGADIREMDLDNPTEADRARIIDTDVFARVAPADKLKIVTLYQKSGQIVAMTGDGVNDAPALKKADIGIAMGKRGTQVAREAAEVVLNDDAFSTIIAAMRQGRVIFANIRKFVVYLMSCNVSEVMVVGVAVGAGLPTPLLPLQILFLNLVTDVFPAFALGLGTGDDTVMDRPPRDPAEPIVDNRRWAYIALLGAAITVATLAAFVLALEWLNLAVPQAITVAFLTLALAQVWNVFNMRTPGSGFWSNEVTRNIWVWGAIALCLGMIGIALWLPVMSDVLSLPDPGWNGLALAFGFSALQLVLGQIVLWLAPPERAVQHDASAHSPDARREQAA
ncbi:cation-translocating P-type ATPase [Aliiroseovarius sp. PTFE2010]|uniref:cation-translocating P-type ATPase n=1 Tax=Aliiroseovarius sp. PTFE2010 TaxID=3417190 RepID=UPI003CE6AD12